MQQHESAKLTQVLIDSYQALHAQQVFGLAPRPYLPLFEALLEETPDPRLPILDFGCGPGGGIASRFPNVVAHDPYLPEYAASPWDRRYRAVYSSDVLEHMTISAIVAFLENCATQAQARLVFLAISTRAANKQLLNGVNAHLTVMSPAWWFGVVQATLHPEYDAVLAWGDFLDDICVLAFRRRVDHENLQPEKEKP